MSRAPEIFIVTGEQSGDQLGFKLMRALRKHGPRGVSIRGVGGPRMQKEGLKSLFPLEDIAVMGFADVLARLPLLKRRIRETAQAVIACRPDVLVIIDSPDFTHRVARAVRKELPDLPIVDYVSPSVWAWRPGRARKMRAYVNLVLALLPFEPAAHKRLGGPRCLYVGHPLIERLQELRPARGERRPLSTGVDLLVMPGSRVSVARRHMALFGEALRGIVNEHDRIDVTIPAAPGLKNEIEMLAQDWPVKPRVVEGEAGRYAAMRRANVALAASGTATLELALSGLPLVGAYRVEPLAKLVARFVKITASHILLPNLILGRRAIPELVADGATAENIAVALRPLLRNSPARRRQQAELKKLDLKMKVSGTPSANAAHAVLDLMRERT